MMNSEADNGAGGGALAPLVSVLKDALTKGKCEMNVNCEILI